MNDDTTINDISPDNTSAVEDLPEDFDLKKLDDPIFLQTLKKGDIQRSKYFDLNDYWSVFDTIEDARDTDMDVEAALARLPEKESRLRNSFFVEMLKISNLKNKEDQRKATEKLFSNILEHIKTAIRLACQLDPNEEINIYNLSDFSFTVDYSYRESNEEIKRRVTAHIESSKKKALALKRKEEADKQKLLKLATALGVKVDLPDLTKQKAIKKKSTKNK